MVLAMLSDAGAAGWLLLILLAGLLFGGMVLAGIAAVSLARWLRSAAYRGTHVDGLGTGADPCLAPVPRGSMQLEDDRLAWERDVRAWEHEFRANHGTADVFAAADQEGGWTSGACTNTDPGGDDPSWAMGPPPAPGPGATPPTARPGHPDVSVPPEGPWLDGLIADVVDPPPELAHDEYSSGPGHGTQGDPAAGHLSPDETPRPGLPPWQADLDAQDQDAALYLATYACRLAGMKRDLTRGLECAA